MVSRAPRSDEHACRRPGHRVLRKAATLGPSSWSLPGRFIELAQLIAPSPELRPWHFVWIGDGVCHKICVLLGSAGVWVSSSVAHRSAGLLRLT